MAKVALVANTDWYLYNFRLSLAQAARQAGHEVLLVSPPGRFAAELAQAGFRWLRWDVGRRSLSPLQELPAMLSLRRIYRSERVELVHHCTIKPVIYGSLAARLAGVPSVVNAITGRGYVYQRQGLLGRPLRAVVGPLYRAAFAHPNCAVVFENEMDRQFFIERGYVSDVSSTGQGSPAGPRSSSTARTYLVRGVGVDTQRFTPGPEPEQGVVVLPARLLTAKGVEDFVEAARLLRASGSTAAEQARFVLVGEPDPGNPTSIPLEQVQAWTAQGLVEWWGFRQDMPAVFREAQVVTLPSLGEGVPTVLLEAAASARPIVATDVPGCRDVVQDGVNGLLVPPHDPPALAAALERLLLDRGLRERMGAAGRSLILEKFTLEQVNLSTLEIYQSLISAAHGAQVGRSAYR